MLPAGLLRLSRPGRCLQLPFLSPPVCYADYPQQAVERGVVARGSASGNFPPHRQHLHAPQWCRAVEEVSMTPSLPFYLIWIVPNESIAEQAELLLSRQTRAGCFFLFFFLYRHPSHPPFFLVVWKDLAATLPSILKPTPQHINSKL